MRDGTATATTSAAAGLFADWLRPEMNSALEQTEKLWKPPVQYIRGRMVGNVCARAITFDSLGHQVPFGAKKLRIFRTGRAIEKEIIANMQLSPSFDCADIAMTYESPEVHGRADVFVRRKEDGKLVCGEIKCVAPDSLILTEELDWVFASSLKVGDRVWGFDEDTPQGPGQTRRIHLSTVTHSKHINLPAFRITTDVGDQLVASGEHLWLTNRGWRATQDLLSYVGKQQGRTSQINVRLKKLSSPWTRDMTREAGYLAAAFDGEGCLVQNKKHLSFLNFNQNENAMLEEVKALLQLKGFAFREQQRVSSSGKPNHTLVLNGGRAEGLRFLGSVRPPRLLEKFNPEGHGIGSFESLPRVVSVEPLGKQDLWALQTTTNTLIVEGYYSHNSINGRGFKSLPMEHGPVLASESPVFAIKRDYVMQLNTYLGADNTKTDEGFLLFENKDDSEQRTFHFVLDDGLRQNALKICRTAESYYMEPSLAPVPEDRAPEGEDKVCAWCDHRPLCVLMKQKGATQYEDMRSIDAELRG